MGDVQQCMYSLLEDAENFHGHEAVEALEDCNKTCELVLYDAKDLPVALQPLAPWDTIENAATKAKVHQAFQPESSKGYKNFSGGKGGNDGVGKGAEANLLSSLVAGLNQAAEED